MDNDTTGVILCMGCGQPIKNGVMYYEGMNGVDTGGPYCFICWNFRHPVEEIGVHTCPYCKRSF